MYTHLRLTCDIIMKRSCTDIQHTTLVSALAEFGHSITFSEVADSAVLMYFLA